MTELLPCPFCGGEAEKLTSIDGFTSIGCLNCNHIFGVMIQRGTEAEAIEAWNTRVKLGNGTCEIALARLVDVAAKVDIDSCAEILECVEAIRKVVGE